MPKINLDTKVDLVALYDSLDKFLPRYINTCFPRPAHKAAATALQEALDDLGAP